MLKYFADFSKKTIQERVQILQKLFPQVNGSYSQGLDLKSSDLMIENCVGSISVPVGLGLNFEVNSKEYIVPMATEESSIVAAASSAAKVIKSNGGFVASCTAPIMFGQIQVLDVAVSDPFDTIKANKAYLMNQANTLHCPRMVARGGGVVDIVFNQLSLNLAVVNISVNVGEAMGANIVNSVCEGLAPEIQRLLKCRTGLKILSNYCTERRVTSSYKIPIERLRYRNIPGEVIAQGFLESFDFARMDPYRACTHNKGILNGIQAVGIVTGQDTRALEAAAHTWASRCGRYQPLNTYTIEKGYLVGKIEMPISVGTKGGALRSNPAYQASLYILGYPSPAELSQIIASVGLACNFAAIRAMISEGIQKGHMGLHGKNIAIATGVPNELVPEVVEYMKQRGNISQQTALDYLSAHRLHTISRKISKPSMPLNTFFANLTENSPPLMLSIAFHCPHLHGVHVSIEKSSNSQLSHINNMLFAHHSYSWITSFLTMLDEAKFEPKYPRTNKSLQMKLKLLCIWIHVISKNLIKIWGVSKTDQAIKAIFSNNLALLESLVEGCEEYVEFGVFLELELWHIINFHLEDFVSSSLPFSDVLSKLIKKEVENVLDGNIKAEFGQGIGFDEILVKRKKQMCATLMYLCDMIGEARIELEMVDQLCEVGDVIEIMSTAKRDFHKASIGEITGPNIFLAWLKSTGKAANEYFDYIMKIIKQKTQKFNENQLGLVLKAEKLLNRYYDISPRL